MALSSMTGFARGHGVAGPYTWAWELKSVNAKGLDLKLRLQGIDTTAVTASACHGARAPAMKRTVLKLYRSERPLPFFGAIGAALGLISIGIAIPLLVTYYYQGVVPRLPTAVLSTGLMVLASLSVACGLVLDTVTRGVALDSAGLPSAIAP